MALEDEHHHIAAAYAETLEIACSLVGLLLYVLEREAFLLTSLARPQQGELAWCLLCPCVHDVVGKVEVLFYLELQVLLEVLFR